MYREQLEELIREEIYKALAEFNALGYDSIDEKSVPEPYDRKKRRRMTKAQIRSRDTLGNAMKKSEKTVRYFKKKFGDDWESYLWATATGKAIKKGA